MVIQIIEITLGITDAIDPLERINVVNLNKSIEDWMEIELLVVYNN